MRSTLIIGILEGGQWQNTGQWVSIFTLVVAIDVVSVIMVLGWKMRMKRIDGSY